MPKYSAQEIVFELGGRQNQYFHLKCLDARLRGRWSKSNEIGTPSQRVNIGALPEIPGIRVRIDAKQRKLIAEDPLGYPENENLLRTCNNILTASVFEGKEGRPWPPMVKEGLTNTELKTALWELACLTWDGKAKAVHGDLLSREEILAMDGQLILRRGDTNTLRPDGTPLPPYATDEEIERLGGKPQKKPAHAG